jgi:simple sugar transport system substrate-binding protein
MSPSRFLLCFVTFTTILASLSCTLPSATPFASLPGSPITGQAQKTYEDLIVGYAQLGAESEWRVANTISIKETAEQLGVELRFLDAQQKQDNQIEAVRKFIVQKVDIIGISPIVETGWQEVFQQAKEAGIPIILVDRRSSGPGGSICVLSGL